MAACVQTAESGRLSAGFASRHLSVEDGVVDHQALQQGHGTVSSLSPQQIQHVALTGER